MNEIELKLVISRFSGNIQGVYNLTRELQDKIGFELDFNFDSSTASQRFTNLVRNMVSKGLVQKPKKIGRTLIFDERTFLQLIVARKYLSAGCSMNAMAGYLVDMPTEEIYQRLFTKQLPDIDKVASRNTISVDQPEVHKPLAKACRRLEKEYPIYHYIMVKPDLFLQAKVDKYQPSELEAMVCLLEQYVADSKLKKADENDDYDVDI